MNGDPFTCPHLPDKLMEVPIVLYTVTFWALLVTEVLVGAQCCSGVFFPRPSLLSSLFLLLLFLLLFSLCWLPFLCAQVLLAVSQTPCRALSVPHRLQAWAFFAG